MLYNHALIRVLLHFKVSQNLCDESIGRPNSIYIIVEEVAPVNHVLAQNFEHESLLQLRCHRFEELILTYVLPT